MVDSPNLAVSSDDEENSCFSELELARLHGQISSLKEELTISEKYKLELASRFTNYQNEG